ncbi:helix-turn-helix domain-containing protein [Yinghuangia seranimata]|uniref:helix-turn-helix domain-containing protein n=1 Tax=Yinghuangia seranimata TaxID=408067 RepID=UPI00248BC60D|nr:helix-turn-helix domain-containing protein [Yinghuangia seranimata]MDI2125246.1 helix-turn-helix domain-containing protein [Yinghuangia seranimata]
MTDFSSRDQPPAERLEWWRDLTDRVTLPTHIAVPRDDDFRARMRVVEFGAVHTSMMSTPPLVAVRTPAMVRRADPEVYLLSMPLGGPIGVSRARGQEIVQAGELVLSASSLPSRAELPERRGILTVSIPRALMPLPKGQVDALVGARMPCTGTAAVTAHMMTRLARGEDSLGVAESARLGTVLVDLVAALVAQRLDAERALCPDTRRREQLVRIHAFIEQRLGDPSLTPATVAAAHHISLRQLHRLFTHQGVGVAGWIRSRRLERCRRDLADPALRHEPVAALAARWGFTHASDFSRAFRTAYGMPPGAYREFGAWGQQPGA